MTQKHIKSSDGSPDLNLDILSLKKAALILRAVNHGLRQQLLKLLHQHGRMTVTEIYKKLRLEQSVTSQHLAVLRTAGFVVTEREGKHIFYSVNYRRLKDLHQFSTTLLS